MNKNIQYGRNADRTRQESAAQALTAESQWQNEKFSQYVDVWETKTASNGQQVQVFVKQIKLGR